MLRPYFPLPQLAAGYELVLPVLLRNQPEDGMEIPYADQLDVGGRAVTLQHGGDIDELPIAVEDARVAKLLEQDAREAHVQPGYIAISVGIAHGSLVAADNLFRFPLVCVDQQAQIPRRLMHMQAERMKDV
jgi:hypothetical protein